MKTTETKRTHRIYMMRNMPETIHRRLRLLAADRDTTLEVQVIRILELGLKSLERRSKEGEDDI